MTSEIATKTTLMELIIKAQGVIPEHGKWAYVFRGDSQKKIDLKRLLEQGDMRTNPVLEPGDVVYIPSQEQTAQAEFKIYVEGEVKSPNMYDYQPGITALNACIMAGGFNQFAAPNRTRIIRRTPEEIITIRINLEKVKDGKIPDIELQPGDRIHVPETWL
jgi:polysaccharide export outer membrane protein